MCEMRNQINLENKVITALNEDNSNHNTFHFDWSEDTESVMLNIISCNSKNGQQFLLITQGGSTKEDCLKFALDRIKKEFPLEYSWRVRWSDADNLEQVSYFRGVNEYQVKSKFYFNNTFNPGGSNSVIIEITKQPIS